MALITIPDPTDLDGTDLPIFEGDLVTLPLALEDGTYVASVTEYDGPDPMLPIDGTVTIADGAVTWRPFSRTPSTVIGARKDGDTFCTEHAPEGAEPLTVGDLTWCEIPSCDDERHPINDYMFDEAGAMEDTHYAVLAATGIAGGRVGTGGGCEAYGIDWPDGRYLYVTNGDAQAPDGLWYSAGVYTTADDDEPRDVIHEAHNPVALARNLRRIAAETAPATTQD
jgi:hypothetical protein